MQSISASGFVAKRESLGALASPLTRIKLLVQVLHEQAQQDIELIHRALHVLDDEPTPAEDAG